MAEKTCLNLAFILVLGRKWLIKVQRKVFNFIKHYIIFLNSAGENNQTSDMRQ